mmetsp:Transcript_11881/g.41648  ORF Transcript_11881/g.41648 Transcript_11881/m.41648 type:complete len:497 (-) Transcript_11881:237-1727(-)
MPLAAAATTTSSTVSPLLVVALFCVRLAVCSRAARGAAGAPCRVATRVCRAAPLAAVAGSVVAARSVATAGVIAGAVPTRVVAIPARSGRGAAAAVCGVRVGCPVRRHCRVRGITDDAGAVERLAGVRARLRVERLRARHPASRLRRLPRRDGGVLVSLLPSRLGVLGREIELGLRARQRHQHGLHELALQDLAARAVRRAAPVLGARHLGPRGLDGLLLLLVVLVAVVGPLRPVLARARVEARRHRHQHLRDGLAEVGALAREARADVARLVAEQVLDAAALAGGVVQRLERLVRTALARDVHGRPVRLVVHVHARARAQQRVDAQDARLGLAEDVQPREARRPLGVQIGARLGEVVDGVVVLHLAREVQRRVAHAVDGIRLAARLQNQPHAFAALLRRCEARVVQRRAFDQIPSINVRAVLDEGLHGGHRGLLCGKVQPGSIVGEGRCHRELGWVLLDVAQRVLQLDLVGGHLFSTVVLLQQLNEGRHDGWKGC